MNKLAIILLILFVQIAQAQKPIALNKITIKGSSNLNTFKLLYPNNQSIKSESSTSIEEETRYNFRIPVNDFKTINRLFHNNFCKLLKAHQFPFIEVQVPSTYILHLRNDSEIKKLNATVSMAGVQKTTQVLINSFEEDTALVSGELNLKLTDFKLETPEKLFGLFKVHNEVIINFNINL